MERNKIIAANFKMNLDSDEINYYVSNFNISDKDVILFPSSIYLDRFKNTDVSLGIQNISFYDNGAYTGEVSARQAKSIGVNYVLIGHSERRAIFDETDIDVSLKIKEALKNNLKVILCIGEPIEERENGNTCEFLSNQLENDLLSIDDLSNVIIAYEPIWAIGTGIIPTVKEIESTVKFIKEKVKQIHNYDIMVLYGGSVNLNNISEINSIPNIDGFLIGGASLDVLKFKNMIEVVRK